ncbi:unnamed protein product [Nezara viridula]|uniref:Uncharacterized protein n=1 Tax=Nezara viridula TaxID=85310 RepID=A0A9P0HIG5_NEZVI|nr:unnamed protein product [Nezara viridula]
MGKVPLTVFERGGEDGVGTLLKSGYKRSPKGCLGHSTCRSVPSIPDGAANSREALVYRVVINAMCHESSDRMPSTRPHMLLFLSPFGMHLYQAGSHLVSPRPAGSGDNIPAGVTVFGCGYETRTVATIPRDTMLR